MSPCNSQFHPHDETAESTQTKMLNGVADVDIYCGQCKDYKHTLPVKFARTDRLFVYKAFSVAALKALLFLLREESFFTTSPCYFATGLILLARSPDIENHFQEESR
jgi:hypothetical protein